jgi:hypothetical protein
MNDEGGERGADALNVAVSRNDFHHEMLSLVPCS